MAAKCWPYWFFLNAHNLPIFQPILMILVSKFMVHRALSDKTYLSFGLLSPLTLKIVFSISVLKLDILSVYTATCKPWMCNLQLADYSDSSKTTEIKSLTHKTPMKTHIEGLKIKKNLWGSSQTPCSPPSHAFSTRWIPPPDHFWLRGDCPVC